MYIKIINQQVVQYPYNDSDLRYEYSNTSFPATLTDEIRQTFNMYKVEQVSIPDFNDRTQKIIEITPTLDNNIWKQTWQIVDLTDEEIQTLCEKKIQEVKNLRLQELQRTDYTQLPDVNLSNKAEWAIYRQALRDITTQPGYPFDVQWPSEPIKE